jgi:hypothetical protein
MVRKDVDDATARRINNLINRLRLLFDRVIFRPFTIQSVSGTRCSISDFVLCPHTLLRIAIVFGYG